MHDWLERFRRYQYWVIAIIDALIINLAFASAYWARYEGEWLQPVEPFNFVAFVEYAPIAVVLTIIQLLVFRVNGLYTPRRGAGWLDRSVTIVSGTVVAWAIVIVGFFLFRPLAYSRLMFAFAIVFSVIGLSLFRLEHLWLLSFLRRHGIGIDRLLIVGAGRAGRALMGNIVALPELGYQVIGFLDDDPVRQSTNIGRFRALGPIGALAKILGEQQPDEVIVTLPAERHAQILAILDECERHQVRVKIVPDLFTLSLNRVSLDDINGIPLIGLREVSISGWNYALKRAMDLILGGFSFAIFALVFFPPIALAIRLDSPGPIFFEQARIGRGGRIFTCYKFRSMRVGADEEVAKLAALNEASGPLFKIKNDPRLTRMGRFFRRTSLDELPQLINVLRGDMSLVGPRPPLPREVVQYEEWHKKRLEVAPGLTGLWQVSGRSLLTFEEMVMLDLFYIENWSLLLDLTIMLRTVPSVLFARGAY